VPALDGLRGLAVAGVLVFHGGHLTGGYLGVDLFFVLSGFLITTILVEEHRRSGRIDLRSFWVRRLRRLMPALLALVPVVAVYARAFAAPAELAAIRSDALATLGYVANWRAILARRSYWDMFAAPSPLEHTWSLAIEEQFYVVWPLLVVLVLRFARGRVRALLAVSAVLALASAAAMATLYEEGHTMRVYLGTDTRGAAILIGAALAASGLARADAPPVRLLDGAGAIALALLGAAWWWLDGQSELLYRGGFWITELAAAVLIACCVRQRGGLVARLLSLRPLRALGVVSYGVYLWHWPIYVLLTEERTGASGAALLALRLGVTALVAIASYRWLEQPIRERGIRAARAVVIVPSAALLAIAIVLVSTRASATAPELPDEPAAPAGKAAAQPTPAARAGRDVPSGWIPPASELPPGTLRVLVVGDSVGLALGARMHFAGGSAGAYVNHRAIGDCSILDGLMPVLSMSGEPHGNGNCARSWVDDVRELRPDVVVVVIGGAYFSTVAVDGHRRGVCHPGWRAPYARRLSELLAAIAPFAGRRVVLEAAYPVGKWQTPTRNRDVDCFNRILAEAAASAGAEIAPLNAFACPDGKCILTSRGAPVRPDGLHFDGLGAEDTARWVLERVRAGAPPPPDE
jgi:peptidoglycan/LPS O-acetylase OafA/YrhL